MFNLLVAICLETRWHIGDRLRVIMNNQIQLAQLTVYLNYFRKNALIRSCSIIMAVIFFDTSSVKWFACEPIRSMNQSVCTGVPTK